MPIQLTVAIETWQNNVVWTE